MRTPFEIQFDRCFGEVFLVLVLCYALSGIALLRIHDLLELKQAHLILPNRIE